MCTALQNCNVTIILHRGTLVHVMIRCWWSFPLPTCILCTSPYKATMIYVFGISPCVHWWLVLRCVFWAGRWNTCYSLHSLSSSIPKAFFPWGWTGSAALSHSWLIISVSWDSLVLGLRVKMRSPVIGYLFSILFQEEYRICSSWQRLLPVFVVDV